MVIPAPQKNNEIQLIWNEAMLFGPNSPVIGLGKAVPMPDHDLLLGAQAERMSASSNDRFRGLANHRYN